ncbi:MAG TPA: antitoxin [Chloroflexi bacterium]|nr:antitoxin [Chloroflexota bacterium]
MLDLHHRIENELDDLERIVRLADKAWQGARRYPDEQRHFLDSLALNFHGFYHGLERIFEAISRRFDPVFPSGERWHSDLLKQMGQEIPGVRPAVLSTETIGKLDEFLAFRHRVRNLYTFNLDAERLRILLQRLPDAWFSAKTDLETFNSLLRQAASDKNE